MKNKKHNFKQFCRKLFILAACLMMLGTASSALANPFEFVFTGTWDSRSPSSWGGSTYTITIIVDNGGTTTANQSYTASDVVSAAIVTGAYSAGGSIVQFSGNGSFSTNAAGEWILSGVNGVDFLEVYTEYTTGRFGRHKLLRISNTSIYWDTKKGRFNTNTGNDNFSQPQVSEPGTLPGGDPVPLNQPPDCSGAAIADQSADGNCQATISAADVTGVTDPDGDAVTITVSPTVLGLGANTVTVSADDGNDGICSTDITVNVVDELDPVLTVANNQLGMWPPNHKYKTFTVADFGVSVSDNCGCCVEATITNVTSNEPDDVKGGGDGNTQNDIVIVDDQTVKLRAERQGGGDGRVYTITLSATDGSGNTTQATCEVIVPQNRNGLPKGIGGFISDTDMASPEDYFLSQNYPNPFNPTTTISFGLPQSELVTLNIYNSNGQLIRTLTSGSYSAGNHNVTWDATDYSGVRVANGIYIYELKTSNYLQQRKMLLMK